MCLGALNNGHHAIADFLQKHHAKLTNNDSRDQLGVKLCALAAAGNLKEIKLLGMFAVAGTCSFRPFTFCFERRTWLRPQHWRL